MAITVIYEPGLERIQIKLHEVELLLRGQGLPTSDINALCIYIQTERSPERREEVRKLREARNEIMVDPLGEWMPGRAYVYIHGHMDSAIHNYTLLHELHHELMGGYQDGEDDQPHDARPSEIAANHFASEQAKQHKLITIPGELTYEVFASKASKFVAVTTTLCACLAAFAIVQHFAK